MSLLPEHDILRDRLSLSHLVRGQIIVRTAGAALKTSWYILQPRTSTWRQHSYVFMLVTN